MSGSNQGPLATRLKVPKGRKSTRKMIAETLKRIEIEPSLLPKDRRELDEIAKNHKVQLEQHGQANDQKAEAVKAAVAAIEVINQRINDALAVRGNAFEKYSKTFNGAEKDIFGALGDEAKQSGINAADVPILKEWTALAETAYRGISAAQDAQSADRIANEFEITSREIVGRAATSRGKIATDMQAAKKLAEDRLAFKTLMEEIAADLDELEVLTGDIDPKSPSRTDEKELSDRYGPNGTDSVTEGLKAAKTLQTSVKQQLSLAGQAGENALAPLKLRFEKNEALATKMREVKTRSLAEETGFDIDLPYMGLTHYWPLVDAKIVTIQRCFDEKMPASGAPFVEAQLDEFDTMLEEVRNFHKGDDAKLGEAINAVNDLVQRKQYYFFDTDLQKFLPNDAKVLNAQFNSIDKDCKEMKPLEILKHMEGLKAAAENAHLRVTKLKALCEVEAKAKLDEATKELDAIVKELAKLPETVRDGHKTFHGEYRQSRDELKAALSFGAEGPDEAKIRTLLARLTNQLAEIKPGNTFDPKAIGDSHTAGCKSEADEKQKKLDVKNKKKEVKLLYTEVEGLVEKSDPGDYAELQAIKRLLKEVDAAVDGLPPDRALERYEQVVTRLEKLKQAPAGMAVLARGMLPEDYKRFAAGLAAAELNLKAFGTVVAQDYAGDGRDALVNLINHSVDTLTKPAATIKKATDEFASNMGVEQMAGRLKARETGLAGVRQYQKLLDEDVVLSALAGSPVFDHAGIAGLLAALNSLELNLLRGI